jgi:hypothetical protein
VTFADWLSDEADEYLARRHGPASRCYTPISPTTVDPADDPFPWAGQDRGPDKTAVVETAVLWGDSPTDPVLRPSVEREVFDARSRADRMVVTRLTQNHPQILKNRTTPEGHGMLEPTRRAVSLIRSMYGCEPLPWLESDLPVKGDTEELPRERYRAVFGRERSIYTDRQRALAVMLHADHRATLTVKTSGGSTVGKRIAGTGLQPATATDQRYASVDRVDRERAKFEAVVDGIAREYDVVTFATFTLPRECADSVLDSYAVLSGRMNRFHGRCKTDPVDPERPNRPGERPAYMWICEPQGDGWGHRHVLYPGRSRLYDADDVRQDWGELIGAPPGVTPQVNLTSVRISEEFDAVRDYCRGPFRGLRALASMSEADVRALAGRLMDGEADDQDRYLAVLTALCPDERRVWWASDDLRRSAAGGATDA